MRIHELAKELGVASKDLIASLEVMGYEGRTASSTVPEEAVPRIRAAGGKVKPGIRPRAATEEQVPKRVYVPPEVPSGDGAGNGQVAADLPQVVEAPAEQPTQTEAALAEPAPVLRVSRG